MTFAERFAAHPLAAFAACIVWVPIAFWVVSFIGWMVTGEIEAIFGVLGLGVAVGLGVLASFSGDPTLGPLIVIAVIITTFLFPFARVAMNKRALVAIDIEQMEKYYDAIKQRPDNVGAMIKLAELLYNRGYPGQAIKLAEKALPSMPPNLFRPEHNMVSAWKMVANNPSIYRPLPCLRCHQYNDAGELDCAHCGYPSVMEMAKGRWLATGTARQLIAVWVGIVIVSVGLPASARLTQKAPVLAVSLIVIQLAIGVYFVLKSFLQGGKHETA